jgi:hypothetical protein
MSLLQTQEVQVHYFNFSTSNAVYNLLLYGKLSCWKGETTNLVQMAKNLCLKFCVCHDLNYSKAVKDKNV